MSTNWNGLLKIQEIKLFTKDHNLKWQKNNLKNIFHAEGQKFMLKCCFANPYKNENERSFPPSRYYLGMDNRTELSATDTISSLDSEPATSTGYKRFAIKPDNFTLESISGVWVAKTPSATFKATSTWGPVNNLFLTTTTQEFNELSELVNVNYLISSVSLGESLSVSSGEFFYVKMSLSLQDING